MQIVIGLTILLVLALLGWLCIEGYVNVVLTVALAIYRHGRRMERARGVATALLNERWVRELERGD